MVNKILWEEDLFKCLIIKVDVDAFLWRRNNEDLPQVCFLDSNSCYLAKLVILQFQDTVRAIFLAGKILYKSVCH